MRRFGWPRACFSAVVCTLLLASAGALAQAQPSRSPGAGAAPAADDRSLVEAREALRKGDRGRLAVLRQQLLASGHPLALWADYWDLSSRLAQASPDEVRAFFDRWSGSYVEDRLRNDWLLETGRRRDWVEFQRELPRFRMNDDREVNCYAILVEALSGVEVRAKALAAWHAQREADDGCHALASHLRDAQFLAPSELWLRLRSTTETGRQRPARQAAQLLGPAVAQALDQLWDKPDAYLKRLATVDRGLQSQLGALAVMRLAPQEPEAAAEQLSAPWAQRLRTDWSAAAWAAVTRAASLKQLESAAGWAERALQLDGRSRAERAAHTGAVAATDLPGRSSVFTLLSDDMLAWIVRASLRDVAQRPQAWLSVAQAIERMSPAEQAEPTWSYWRARALLARSRPGSAGEVLLSEAQDLLRRIASPLHFYGQLAGAELGERPAPLPSAPELDAAERQEAASKPGLVRALRMLELGLRSEGLREWNFTLIGQTDRQILAAAALACDRQVVDRCISAAERTREQTDASLRYPLAFREEITAAAQASGVDAALVFGLIRQESRFAIQARSSVGAAGLMQVMPPTARWTAKRIGLELPADWRDDRATNLRLGTAYLRMVVDDFGASLPMALAAYNAGPSRSRRWREGPTLEPAIWAETIPFHETRDYVKKVLANAAVYAQRLGSKEPAALKGWLGPSIGPRDPSTPLPNKELP